MLPFSFVLIALNLFAPHAVPELEQLDDVLRRLFEHYEPSNVPCVESDAVLSVHYEFSEEFECD